MSLLGLIIGFLAKAKTRFSQKLLIVFFANAFFFLLYYYGYLHRFRIIGGVGILFGHGVGFLLGPVLYYYLQSIVFPKEKIITPLYKSLLPYLLVWLFISLPLAMALAFNTLKYFHGLYLKYEAILNHIENIYFFCYLLISLRFLGKFQKAYKENYSTINKNDLIWYRQLIYGFMIIVCLDTFCTLYEAYYPMLPWNIGTVVAFTMIAMYAYLGYKGLFQSQILIPDFLLDTLTVPIAEKETISEQVDSKEPAIEKTKVKQLDSLSENDIELLKSKVIALLEDDKLHLNESLNLAEMANSVGITDKKLSELLNRHLNTSFYNLVNEYRVREVKARLDTIDSDKYTLLAIAYDSGFQSKASFNRIFKQKTGVSPAAYRKKTTKLPQQSVNQTIDL